MPQQSLMDGNAPTGNIAFPASSDSEKEQSATEMADRQRSVYSNTLVIHVMDASFWMLK